MLMPATSRGASDGYQHYTLPHCLGLSSHIEVIYASCLHTIGFSVSERKDLIISHIPIFLGTVGVFVLYVPVHNPWQYIHM